jgi:hypothetical protein
MGLSTFQEFVGGKRMFLCFYVKNNVPVDTALGVAIKVNKFFLPKGKALKICL